MKTYVWSLPTRLFHTLLVIFVLISYITAEWEDYLNIHAAFGFSLLALLAFRAVWGVMGPRYSRFKDLTLDLGELKEYMSRIFGGKKEYAGHNPAASFVMTGIFAVLLLLVLSGLLTYGIQENRGLFSFLHSSFFKEMELFEEIHEFLGALLWVLIGAHIGGVLLDRLFNAKEGTLGSILTGYKNIDAPGVSLTLFQKAVSFVGIGASLFLLLYTLSYKDNIITAGYDKEVDYKKEHALFAKECGSCHMIYPPTLLGQESWRNMMSSLDDHFGDDASLDDAEEADILKYLLANSAESSTSEASVGILKSIQNKDTIAITQTPFWKKRHAKIDPRQFKSDEVKSRANCKACHTDAPKGLIEDHNIKMPALKEAA